MPVIVPNSSVASLSRLSLRGLCSRHYQKTAGTRSLTRGEFRLVRVEYVSDFFVLVDCRLSGCGVSNGFELESLMH